MSVPWLGRVRRQLARLRNRGVVVAVSGGGDSVGMLRFLHEVGAEYGLRPSVAHLDHGTRGEEGRGDARFVADLAASLGLPFDLGHWRASRPGHFEADARQGRYEWLVGVAKARGSAFVAVGQTLDDQAETILHRVARGTGLRGLAGMPRRRRLAPGVVLVRPLLDVSRREIREYLEAIGQGFREDSTNLDTSRMRALIRLELLPELAEKVNPGVAGALVRLGRIAAESGRALGRLAGQQLDAIWLESGPDRVILDRSGLARLARSERAEVLRVAWRRLGWPERGMDAGRWRRLAGLGWSRISVGAGVEGSMTADRVVLSRAIAEAAPSRREPVPLPVPVPGWAGWEGGRVGTLLGLDDLVDESVDLDAIILPLTVRQAGPGDRFQPLGLLEGTQALNDFFRGRRVPRQHRGSIPIVCDQSGIIWVVGHRIAHRVRLTDATTRTLGLRFEPNSSV